MFSTLSRTAFYRSSSLKVAQPRRLREKGCVVFKDTVQYVIHTQPGFKYQGYKSSPKSSQTAAVTPSLWTTEEAHVKKLLDNEITGDTLLEMTEERLLRYGIPGEPAIKLAKAIEGLKTPTAMFKLWNTLLTGDYKDEDGVIRLPDGVTWPTEQKKHSELLFVRKCNEDLFDIIVSLSAPQLPESGVIITGNTGIGKSWFLSYCLFRLAKEKKKVVFESVRNNQRWLFKPDGSVTQIKGDWPPEMNDPTTYFLFDPYGGAPREPERFCAFTIVASSPDKQNFKEFEKQTGSQKFYMPCWTWDEIERIIPYLQFDHETARQRYQKFGGILRYIFNTTTKWDNELEKTISIMDCRDLRMSVGGPEMLESVSHKILQYEVHVPSYESSYVRFASDYVKDKVISRLAQEQHNELLHFVSSYSRDKPILAVLRGDIFETLAHTILCKGGRFLVRPLNETETKPTELEFPALTEKLFSNLDMGCFQDGMYARPLSKRFPAFDSFGTTESGLTRAFQFTVNEAHGLNYDGVSAVLALLKKPLDIYFVVPSDKFASFPKQTIKKPGQNSETPMEGDTRKGPGRPKKVYPELEEHVRQYVLRINLTEY